MSQLKNIYEKEVVPKLMETFKYKNIMQVPALEKIILNMGMGEAIQNIKVLDSAAEELKALAGQKPVITRAKKSIAAFKLREENHFLSKWQHYIFCNLIIFCRIIWVLPYFRKT